MSSVPQTSIKNLSISSSDAVPSLSSDLEKTEATLGSLLGAFTGIQKSMDRNGADYPSQQGSHSQYPPTLPVSQSDESTIPQTSGAQYGSQPAIKTQTDSPPEYAHYPTSARSSNFPDHVHRQTHPASNHSGSGGGMPQSISPSLPIQDARQNNHNAQMKSDREVPIDPSIAASSPTYPTHNAQFSPYAAPPPPQHQDMSQPYASHPASAMYAQPRTEWPGYAGPPPHTMHGGYAMTGAPTTSVAAPVGVRSSQVYSFVPIPGSQQHKRPRRRYEEIERMYKCGWNGCEKAYGTLNHLNAHVTMQSHGSKRTPDEFKEIRKEWKARKKEEENQRKAEEERNRVVASNEPRSDGIATTSFSQPNRPLQLPSIGYQPDSQVQTQYPASTSPGVPQIQQEFNQGQLTYSGYPASPYGAAPNQMYNQHNVNNPLNGGNRNGNNGPSSSNAGNVGNSGNGNNSITGQPQKYER